MEDKFIRENNEKKALKLAFKELRKKINVEITKGSRTFGRNCKKFLVLGKNHAHLLYEMMGRGIDEDGDLDISDLDMFNYVTSELKFFDVSIYVTPEDDVVMVVASLGNLFDSAFMNPFCKQSNKFHLDLGALIDELPNSAKFKKV